MRERQALEFSPVQAPAEGVSPQTDEGVRAENERLKKVLRAASDDVRQVSTRLANVALGPDDIKALFGELTPVSPAEPTPEPPTGAPAPCVWRKTASTLLAYGHEERDAALKAKRRDDFLRWSAWVDALERLTRAVEDKDCGHPLTMEPQEDRP